MSEDKKMPQNLPPQINPEVMKQLLAAMQAQQKQQMTPRQAMITKVSQKLAHALQRIIHALDRFINFVVKPVDTDRNEVTQASRAPVLFGTYVIILFFGFGGIWSATAPLDSAAVALGTLISNSNKQILNHSEGGILKKIYVKQGDHVKQGDPIIALDDAKIRSEYDQSLSHYRNFMAMEARLIAERDNANNIVFPEALLKDANNHEVQKMLDTQQSLFESRKELYHASKNIAQNKLIQTEKELESIQAQKISAIKTYHTTVEKTKSARALQHKGYVHNSAMLEYEAKEEEAKSRVSAYEAMAAKAEQEIGSTRIQLMSADNSHMEGVLKELKDVQMQLVEYRERYSRAKNFLDHVILTSPVDGVVNSLKVHTLGSLVSPGHPIAEISPTNDMLIIEAKVAPQDIDSLYPGLKAKMRFSAFKSRTTPVFTGTLISISPDVVYDPQLHPSQPGGAYYLARIELDMDEFNNESKARKLELHPGMGVEVQIVRGTRTLLRYLLDPVTDTMFKGFKEK